MTRTVIEAMKSEIIVARPPVAVNAIARPFSAEPVRVELPEGGTLADILEVVQPDPVLRRFAHVYVGDSYICPTYYHHVRPKAGTEVSIRIVPGQGGGGGGQKNTLSIVLRIAVTIIAAIATFYIGGTGGILVNAGWSAGSAALAGAAVGAAIPVAGPLLVTGAFPTRPV